MLGASHVTLNDWDQKWLDNEATWHRSQGDETLRNCVDILTGSRAAVKIFFPLCGKAVDMKWMADRGHKVVGVEFSNKPIKEFFAEQGLEYSIETYGEGASAMPVYRTKDNSIRIYQGDLFNFTVHAEGKFDSIWDSGSLVAINKEDRTRYAELMLSLMSREAGGCRYMVRCFEYDERLFLGPPNAIQESVLSQLYGQTCDITTVELTDALGTGRQKFCPDFDYFRVHTYLLQFKS